MRQQRRTFSARRRTVAAAAAFRAAAVGNDAQTVGLGSCPIVIPATAQVDDVAIMSILCGNDTATFTPPSGWTAIRTDAMGTVAKTGLYYRTLQSGDAGTTATFNISGTNRLIGHMLVFSGVTATGMLNGAIISEASSTTPALPSVGSVPAGAMVVGIITRRRGATPAPGISFPNGGYTSGDIGWVSTNFGAIPECSMEAAYKVASTSGTYGGDTEAQSASSTGSNYLIVLPAA